MNGAALATARKVVIPDLVEEVRKSDGFVTFHVTDIKVLLDLIADLCPTHGSCERCEAAVCEDCGLGGWAFCPCDAMHCQSADCQAACIADCHLDDDRHAPASWAGMLR